MTTQTSADQAVYDWQPCSILLPRIGFVLSRYGVRTRLILPGQYKVRRSRSLGRWIYRHSYAED